MEIRRQYIVVFIFSIADSTHVLYGLGEQGRWLCHRPCNLDTQRTDPYKRNFVSTLLRCKGWNVFVVAAGSWSPPAMSTALEAGACVPSLI